MKKILILDDEKIISSSLERVLSKNGFLVSAFNNGIQAIRKIQAEADTNSFFDLAFVDLLMPELSGGDVLDFLKKTSASTQVVMMTAYGDLNVREDLLRRGAAQVLAKPFDDIFQIPELAKKVLAAKK
jgi:DNA-binding NtrC family response regulator